MKSEVGPVHGVQVGTQRCLGLALERVFRVSRIPPPLPRFMPVAQSRSALSMASIQPVFHDVLAIDNNVLARHRPFLFHSEL